MDSHTAVTIDTPSHIQGVEKASQAAFWTPKKIALAVLGAFLLASLLAGAAFLAAHFAAGASSSSSPAIKAGMAGMVMAPQQTCTPTTGSNSVTSFPAYVDNARTIPHGGVYYNGEDVDFWVICEEAGAIDVSIRQQGTGTLYDDSVFTTTATCKWNTTTQKFEARVRPMTGNKFPAGKTFYVHISNGTFSTSEDYTFERANLYNCKAGIFSIKASSWANQRNECVQNPKMLGCHSSLYYNYKQICVDSTTMATLTHADACVHITKPAPTTELTEKCSTTIGCLPGQVCTNDMTIDAGITTNGVCQGAATAECGKDSDCGAGKMCNSAQKCVTRPPADECTTDADCTSDKMCDGTKKCVARPTETCAASPSHQGCNSFLYTPAGVKCQDKIGCPSGQWCDTGTLSIEGNVTTDGVCRTSTNPPTRQCNLDSECSLDKVCNSLGRCVEATTLTGTWKADGTYGECANSAIGCLEMQTKKANHLCVDDDGSTISENSCSGSAPDVFTDCDTPSDCGSGYKCKFDLETYNGITIKNGSCVVDENYSSGSSGSSAAVYGASNQAVIFAAAVVALVAALF